MTQKLDIPFIKSRGNECGQTCTAMMIKYYYPDFVPNFDEMNQIIHANLGKYTHPPQMGLLLQHYGIRSRVFSSDDIKLSSEDPGQRQRWFGQDYEYEQQYIDIEASDWMVREMRELGLFEIKQSAFSELLDLFHQGHLVCFPIDWNRLQGIDGPYEGHFIILSGVNNEELLIHDPDIGPFLSFPRAKLQPAWEHPAIEDDYFVAYGKFKSGEPRI